MQHGSAHLAINRGILRILGGLCLAVAVCHSMCGCASESKQSVVPENGAAPPPKKKSSSRKGDEIEAVPTPPDRKVEIVSFVGGTHRAMLVSEGRWFQLFRNELLVLDVRSGEVLSRVELAPFGTMGPAADLIRDGDKLMVVMWGDAVITLELGHSDLPRISSIETSESLRIRPRRISKAGGTIFVSGDGGVIRWNDRTPFTAPEFATGAGTVVTAASGRTTGQVVCVGRSVYSLGDGQLLASATELFELPPESGGAMAFARQAREGFTVGVMSANVDEMCSEVMPGVVQRFRWFDDRLWAVTDSRIVSWTVREGQLGDRAEFAVRGARDVARLGPNALAVSGSFGRAFYREKPENGLPGDSFYGAHREASRLTAAIQDNRRILAGSEEGNWLYLIGAEAELTTRTLGVWQTPITRVRGEWGSAEIGEDGRSVTGTMDGIPQTFIPDGRPRITCLAAVGRELWIGHEEGIHVIGRGSSGLIIAIGSIRLDGPVPYVFPKWDGGAAWVAEYGGFGVARVTKVDPVVPMGSEESSSAKPSGKAKEKDKKKEKDVDGTSEKEKTEP